MEEFYFLQRFKYHQGKKKISDMENNKIPYICGLTASPLTDSIDYTKSYDLLYSQIEKSLFDLCY